MMNNNNNNTDEDDTYDPYGNNQDTLRTETGAVPIPRNFFRNEFRDDVFNGTLTENHKWEQFFWTRETVEEIIKGLAYVYEEKTCCMTTPSLAHRWHELGRDEVLLDIDTRFNYLPKFRFFDIRNPVYENQENPFRLLVLDPPFFVIPVDEIRAAVDTITGGDFSTKIIIAWLLRAEKSLRIAFRPYNLVPTTFQLQYASIKPNKWKNFVLYSNIDLPGIKRIKE
jgi:hypothetical protein